MLHPGQIARFTTRRWRSGEHGKKSASYHYGHCRKEDLTVHSQIDIVADGFIRRTTLTCKTCGQVWSEAAPVGEG